MSEEIFGTYALTEEEEERLENNFTYHRPFGDLPARYEKLRADTKALAQTYCELAPGSRELSLALTKLEEAVMWVNAAIARNREETAKEVHGAADADEESEEVEGDQDDNPVEEVEPEPEIEEKAEEAQVEEAE